MKNLWDILIDKLYSIKDLGYVGSANIIGSGISAVFWLYLANLLGAEDYGEIQYYLAIAGVVYLVSSFGTPNTIAVYAAKNIKINSTLFLISLVGGFIALLVLLGIFQRLDIGLIILGYIIFDLTINYLLGKKLYSKYSKYFLTQKILSLVLGFGFYYVFGLDGIIYGLAASYIPFTIIIYKICKESEINFSELKSRGGFITNNYFESSIGGLRGEVDKLIIAPLLGFAILGIGASSIVPIAYSLAGKVKGVDSGVGITIVSVAVYGTFIGAPASLGFVANSYGVNNVFTPILLIFILILLPIIIFKKEFKL